MNFVPALPGIKISPAVYATLLGLAHGISDGAAGLLLGGIAATGNLSQAGMAVLLYNGLAFGIQPFVGLLVDRLVRPRWAAAGGLLLTSLALFVFLTGVPALAAAVLAGLGSALYHVGGGALALGCSPGRAAAPGVFAAPGVLGLAVGAGLAASGAAGWLAAGLLGALSIPLALLIPPGRFRETSLPDLGWEGRELAILLILLAVGLRSSVWTAQQAQLEGQAGLLLSLAGSAAAGKLAGGLIADRLGWQRWSAGAFISACLLLSLGGFRPASLLPGMFLLQSTTPVLLAAMGRAIPNGPATAAGLALGLGTLLGGLPALAGAAPGFTRPAALIPTLLLAAAAAFWSAANLSATDRSALLPLSQLSPNPRSPEHKSS